MAETDVTRILQELAGINTKLDAIIKQGDDHEKRLRALEGASGKKWDGLSTTIFTALATALIGYFIGKIL